VLCDRYLPGIQDFIDQFRNNFATVADQYRTNGMTRFAGKTRQVRPPPSVPIRGGATAKGD
jgi:hypothetical protein